MCCTVQILSLLTSRPEKEIIRDITPLFLPRSTHLRHRLWVSTQPESFSNRTSSPVTVLTVNRWQKLINHEVVNVSKTKERERGEKPDGQINRKTSSLGKRTKKTETDWAEIKSMNKKIKKHILIRPSVPTERRWRVGSWLVCPQLFLISAWIEESIQTSAGHRTGQHRDVFQHVVLNNPLWHPGMTAAEILKGFWHMDVRRW